MDVRSAPTKVGGSCTCGTSASANTRKISALSVCVGRGGYGVSSDEAGAIDEGVRTAFNVGIGNGCAAVAAECVRGCAARIDDGAGTETCGGALCQRACDDMVVEHARSDSE